MSLNSLVPLRPDANYYGIQMANTEHRTWEQSPDESISQLTYNWENVDASIYHPLRDVMIAVAQAYPDVEKAEVKRMANAIKDLQRMELSDPVFAVDGQNIEKIGFIADKEIVTEREVKLAVQWLNQEEFGTVVKPVFDTRLEIQRLTPYQLSVIEEQFPKQMEIAYELLPVARIAGDHRAFESFSMGNVVEKIPEESQKEDKGGTVTVFYGTNRIPDGVVDGKQQYQNNDHDELHYGTCEVQLPEGHVQGELERPGWFVPENEHIHVVVKKVIETNEAEFIEDFKQKLAERPKQHALIFVHGYRTTFEEAALRAAQLAWDIPFAGYTGFFSWPSAGKLLPYFGDDRQARGSVMVFKQFIKTLLEIKEIEQLHFIAHSMGSLVLTLTVKELTYDPSVANDLGRIFQLILGAPDIDKKDFKDNILPAFSGVGQQRTMYASDHDLALEWSGVFRSFKERVGHVGEDIFVGTGLDTVEASNLKTPSSHSYLFQSKELLSDLYYLLTQGLPPNQRRLRQIQHQPRPYWLFPK
ncbi:hypothetical protein GCM10027037_11920 [Mucilaginibacter koreensis]